MIVMKFGGSSLASTQSLHRVVPIVTAELHRRPVIVASALGDTTDLLVELLACASRGNGYSCWKLQDALKNYHFSVASDLLAGTSCPLFEDYLRTVFRDLHIRMCELCEGERLCTPELQDWTLSLGEQLSSRLLTAVLGEHCTENAVHLDARKLILTDDNFTNAQPRYWETYARIRWAAAPFIAQNALIVTGGFIGSTEDGRTTTLGRGGSDLTASILGAALNADEIQVWKDVDGMLTWDPRIMPGAHRVSTLSYDEAQELAHAGATILHPHTVEPARRLRIPIQIRNTFHPEAPGTRITVMTETAVPVKSIAVRDNLTLLEFSVVDPSGSCDGLIELCRRQKSSVTVLHRSETTACIAIDGNASISEQPLENSPALRAKIKSHQAVVTIVGELSQGTTAKVQTALRTMPYQVIPSDTPNLSMRLAIPQGCIEQCLRHLNAAFFGAPEVQANLPETFRRPATIPQQASQPLAAPAHPRPFVLSPAMVQPN